ncbi:hypothetical protein BgiBS90_038209, partial [Biomphalaria glabrata]
DPPARQPRRTLATDKVVNAYPSNCSQAESQVSVRQVSAFRSKTLPERLRRLNLRLNIFLRGDPPARPPRRTLATDKVDNAYPSNCSQAESQVSVRQVSAFRSKTLPERLRRLNLRLNIFLRGDPPARPPRRTLATDKVDNAYPSNCSQAESQVSVRQVSAFRSKTLPERLRRLNLRLNIFLRGDPPARPPRRTLATDKVDNAYPSNCSQAESQVSVRQVSAFRSKTLPERLRRLNLRLNIFLRGDPARPPRRTLATDKVDNAYPSNCSQAESQVSVRQVSAFRSKTLPERLRRLNLRLNIFLRGDPPARPPRRTLATDKVDNAYPSNCSQAESQVSVRQVSAFRSKTLPERLRRLNLRLNIFLRGDPPARPPRRTLATDKVDNAYPSNCSQAESQVSVRQVSAFRSKTLPERLRRLNLRLNIFLRGDPPARPPRRTLATDKVDNAYPSNCSQAESQVSVRQVSAFRSKTLPERLRRRPSARPPRRTLATDKVDNAYPSNCSQAESQVSVRQVSAFRSKTLPERLRRLNLRLNIFLRGDPPARPPRRTLATDKVDNAYPSNCSQAESQVSVRQVSAFRSKTLPERLRRLNLRLNIFLRGDPPARPPRRTLATDKVDNAYPSNCSQAESQVSVRQVSAFRSKTLPERLRRLNLRLNIFLRGDPPARPPRRTLATDKVDNAYPSNCSQAESQVSVRQVSAFRSKTLPERLRRLNLRLNIFLRGDPPARPPRRTLATDKVDNAYPSNCSQAESQVSVRQVSAFRSKTLPERLRRLNLRLNIFLRGDPPARPPRRTLATDKVDNAYPSNCSQAESQVSVRQVSAFRSKTLPERLRRLNLRLNIFLRGDPPARPPRRTLATDKVDNAYPSNCSQAESQVSVRDPPARPPRRTLATDKVVNAYPSNCSQAESQVSVRQVSAFRSKTLPERLRRLNLRLNIFLRGDPPARPPRRTLATDKVDNAYPSNCSQAESQVSVRQVSAFRSKTLPERLRRLNLRLNIFLRGDPPARPPRRTLATDKVDNAYPSNCSQAESQVSVRQVSAFRSKTLPERLRRLNLRLNIFLRGDPPARPPRRTLATDKVDNAYPSNCSQAESQVSVRQVSAFRSKTLPERLRRLNLRLNIFLRGDPPARPPRRTLATDKVDNAYPSNCSQAESQVSVRQVSAFRSKTLPERLRRLNLRLNIFLRGDPPARPPRRTLATDKVDNAYPSNCSQAESQVSVRQVSAFRSKTLPERLRRLNLRLNIFLRGDPPARPPRRTLATDKVDNAYPSNCSQAESQVSVRQVSAFRSKTLPERLRRLNLRLNIFLRGDPPARPPRRTLATDKVDNAYPSNCSQAESQVSVRQVSAFRSKTLPERLRRLNLRLNIFLRGDPPARPPRRTLATDKVDNAYPSNCSQAESQVSVRQVSAFRSKTLPERLRRLNLRLNIFLRGDPPARPPRRTLATDKVDNAYPSNCSQAESQVSVRQVSAFRSKTLPERLRRLNLRLNIFLRGDPPARPPRRTLATDKVDNAYPSNCSQAESQVSVRQVSAFRSKTLPERLRRLNLRLNIFLRGDPPARPPRRTLATDKVDNAYPSNCSQAESQVSVRQVSAFRSKTLPERLRRLNLRLNIFLRGDPPARPPRRTLATDKVDNAYPSNCSQAESQVSVRQVSAFRSKTLPERLRRLNLRLNIFLRGDPPARPPRRTLATDKVDNAYPSNCSQAESQVSVRDPPARPPRRTLATDKVDNAYPSNCSQAESQVSVRQVSAFRSKTLPERLRRLNLRLNIFLRGDPPARPPRRTLATDKVDNAYPSNCSQAESQVSVRQVSAFRSKTLPERLRRLNLRLNIFLRGDPPARPPRRTLATDKVDNAYPSNCSQAESQVSVRQVSAFRSKTLPERLRRLNLRLNIFLRGDPPARPPRRTLATDKVDNAYPSNCSQAESQVSVRQVSAFRSKTLPERLRRLNLRLNIFLRGDPPARPPRRTLATDKVDNAYPSNCSQAESQVSVRQVSAFRSKTLPERLRRLNLRLNIFLRGDPPARPPRRTLATDKVDNAYPSNCSQAESQVSVRQVSAFRSKTLPERLRRLNLRLNIFLRGDPPARPPRRTLATDKVDNAYPSNCSQAESQVSVRQVSAFRSKTLPERLRRLNLRLNIFLRGDPPARPPRRTLATDKVDNAYPSNCSQAESQVSVRQVSAFRSKTLPERLRRLNLRLNIFLRGDPPARPPRRTLATDKVDNAYPSNCSQAESQVSVRQVSAFRSKTLPERLRRLNLRLNIFYEATLPPARLVGRSLRIRSTTPTHLIARKRKVKSQYVKSALFAARPSQKD